MKPEEAGTKGAKFEKVAEHTLRWIETHGLSKINLSRIAHQSGVSRTWIYKYIGSTQQDWITHAVIHFGAQVGRLNRPETVQGAIRNRRLWLSVGHESWMELAEMGRRHVWLFPLYYRYKGTKNPIGECIRRIEETVIERYARELRELFKLPSERAQTVAASIVCVRMALAHQAQFLPLGGKVGSRTEALGLMASEYLRMLDGLGLRPE